MSKVQSPKSTVETHRYVARERALSGERESAGKPLLLTRIFDYVCAERRIPKGFRNKAQGCEERATLGSCARIDNNPERVAAHGHRERSQATTPLGL